MDQRRGIPDVQPLEDVIGAEQNRTAWSRIDPSLSGEFQVRYKRLVVSHYRFDVHLITKTLIECASIHAHVGNITPNSLQ